VRFPRSVSDFVENLLSDDDVMAILAGDMALPDALSWGAINAVVLGGRREVIELVQEEAESRDWSFSALVDTVLAEFPDRFGFFPSFNYVLFYLAVLRMLKRGAGNVEQAGVMGGVFEGSGGGASGVV